jgi:hypothetical protein
VSKQLGAWLIVGGTVLVIVGLLLVTGALSWFGKLPGDIRITGEHTRVYIPITSMLLISLALNAIVWLSLWILRR